MKKIIIIMLVFIMSLGVLVSCGRTTTEPISKETSIDPSTESLETINKDTVIETNDESSITTTAITEDRLTTETTEAVDEFKPETYGYTIEKIGNDYYIKFLFSLPSSNQMITYPSISSLQNFYNMLHKKIPISNNDLAHIRSCFEKDNIGYKILDIDNIYYPILPQGITFQSSDMPIFWMQYTYCFSINYDRVLQSYGISDGDLRIMTKYEDYMERYNNEIYSNATVLTEGDKEARVTVQFYEDDYEEYYEYRALIKSGDIYAEIQLAAREPFTDNSIFLDFDFAKYEG